MRECPSFLCIVSKSQTTFRPDQFVSLTENDSQLSLVMDEKSVAAMQNAMYPQYTGKIWRAIQIYEGEDALSTVFFFLEVFFLDLIFHFFSTDATGIVSSIAAPLARDGFSVLYISMYNSDLILVEEDQLSPALASIEQALQKLREKSPASLLPDVAKLVAVGSSPSSSTTITTTTSIRQPSSSLKNNSIEFSVVNSKLHLGWLRKTDVKHSCFPLMRLLLSPTQPDRFFSFTLAADEISIVISEEDYAVGEHHHGVEERDKQQSSIAFHQETWCAMEASVRNPKISTS